MAAVELQRDRAAPGATRDMSGPEIEGIDQRREAVRIVREAKIRGHVGRATRSRLVPRDDGELVCKRGELWLPNAGILRRTVHEHERRPLAGALVDDLESGRPNDVHGGNVQPARAPSDDFTDRTHRSRTHRPNGTPARLALVR